MTNDEFIKELNKRVLDGDISTGHLLDAVEGVINQMRFWAFDEAKTAKTASLLVGFNRIFTFHDKISKLTKSVNAAKVMLKEKTIPERFESEDLKTITLDKIGFRFTVSSQLRASIKKDKKAEAYEWLRENGLGDIIQETVNSSTLSALAKDLLSQAKELDDELFNSQYYDNTSMTKV
jgi:hypothetical protein